MKVEWMNHTGLSVSNMDRSLEFYRDTLGLEIERDSILEGDFLAQFTGLPESRVHIVYLGNGDGRHSVELVEFLNPIAPPQEHNLLGSSHLGFFVDDLDQFYTELSSKGIRFLSPPILRPDTTYPMVRKLCLAQDPDGNWLEFMERAPAPGRRQSLPCRPVPILRFKRFTGHGHQWWGKVEGRTLLLVGILAVK